MEENNTLIKNSIISDKINDYQFINNQNLSEIIIPENVNYIGEGAFHNCKKLKKVILPENLTYIGNRAFCGCESLEEIILPKNIKKLNFRTFADCKRLKRVIIPEGLEELDFAVFSGCENLEEIILPESIKKIDKQLFLNCKKLKRVTLPTNLEEIPDECFKGCHCLDITLNKNIKKIGSRAFQKCYKLSNFPINVTTFNNDCFKDCRNLTSANINTKTTYLPDGMFDGCINLKEIIYQNDKRLQIGKRCFRNCKSITEIPSFIANFNERAFENCTNITSIDIITSKIPSACFRGCTNLKTIINEEKIIYIEDFAFSNCKNLEKIKLKRAQIISAEAFSNCKKLVKVRLNFELTKIGSRAFYNCEILENINLPDSIEIIKKEAFKNCNSIKEITIPCNLQSFSDAAFSYMESLETINVSPFNKTFITPDHKILINQQQQKLVLYASGSKDKSYSLKEYNINSELFKQEIIKPITYIGEFAFAGAKNLEELTVCNCTNDIEYTAFKDCPNLKKLNIESIPFFSSHGFRLRDHGNYYTNEMAKYPLDIPFKSVEYNGEIIAIFAYALQGFTNVENITLPSNKSCVINENAFNDCKKLTKIFIPKNVKTIKKNVFPNSTTLEFDNGIKTNGLVYLTNENNDSNYKKLSDNILKYENDDGIYIKINLKNLQELTNVTFEYLKDYILYTINNDAFYVEEDDKITIISKQYIDKTCSHSEEIRDNPVLFVDFMNDLINNDLAIKPLFNGILMSKMNLNSRKLLIDNLKKDDNFFLDVLKNSGILDESDSFTQFLLENFEQVISKINILKKYNIKDPIICNKILMCCISDETFEELIKIDYALFKEFIKNSEITKLPDTPSVSHLLLNNKNIGENLLAYIKMLKKENKKSEKLLMNQVFIINNSPLCTKLIKNFDGNMKRLLKASKIFDAKASKMTDKNFKDMQQNFLDLLNLLEITGALNENLITRQRARTFITEKIFDEILPNGEKNDFRIIGDDIHRIFNFSQTKTEYNKEFATFFLENYRKLHKYEKEHSGIIERIYKKFDDISITCTSNKGSQRKLKVTLDKCISYLQTNKFQNVSKENKDLAVLIGWWYDKNESWEKALMVYKESLKAPRNIFTKNTLDENGNIIYDNNPINDLKEDLNENFSFEWLPKQDYDNLILGKYCNCCAHIEGAGQGIMRASMILDNCQNLVIRDYKGKIIAKSTLYVNKEEGYAVFNNVESSLNNRTPEEIKKIYNAFIRGVNAFIDAYNKNNQELPINKITIGASRNTILKHLENDNHPIVEVLKSISYGQYSIGRWSSYNGDWSSKQRLVLKR